MRVLHVAHQYPPDHVGGVELYTQAMARRQAAAGHEVAVFCPEPGDATGAVEDGARVYRAGEARRGRAAVFLSAFGSSSLAAEFERVLDIEQPDVVHLQHLMGLPVEIAEQLYRRRIPYLVTLHDYWYGCANAQLLTNYDQTVCDGPNSLFTNCGRCALARAGVGWLMPAAPVVAPLMARRNRLLRPVFDGAAVVLASTPFVRQAYAGMGFPAERVRLLPLGADVTDGDIAAARAAHRAARAVPSADGQFRVGYVGGISPQKGVHHLIAAANGLPEWVTVAIYGDTAALPDYVAELRGAIARPGIQLVGPLDRAALWPALGALDVLVAPTLWYETYALVVQEAFAAGVPVVASRIGVLPDVVADGVNGRLFPPGDAAALRATLLQLAEYPEQMAALRVGIPPVMTMDEHARQLQAIYREALADA